MNLHEAIKTVIAEEVAPLKKEMAYLKAALPDEVDTKEACRITGKSHDFLEAERARKNTLIRYTYQGKKVLYFRSSLIAYLESKGQTHESIVQVLKAA